MNIKLPPLLEPDIFSYVVTVWRDGVECEIDKGPRYTVEQMEAYAREAVRLNMAPLSDEQFLAALKTIPDWRKVTAYMPTPRDVKDAVEKAHGIKK